MSNTNNGNIIDVNPEELKEVNNMEDNKKFDEELKDETTQEQTGEESTEIVETEQPKKKISKKVLIIGGVVITVVIIGGVVAYILYRGKKAEKEVKIEAKDLDKVIDLDKILEKTPELISDESVDKAIEAIEKADKKVK